MFVDAYIKLDQRAAESALAEINPLLEGSHYRPETATVMAQALSFYPGFSLLDIADHEVTPLKKRHAVYKPGHVEILDGTNAPIYRLNTAAPIKLDADNAASYVRFFFMYVRGKHGRFVIAETVDAIAWKEDPPPAARKAIGQMLGPVELLDVDKDGSFRLVAPMMFRESLFRADVRVRPDGLVKVSDEKLVIEDMPVFDDMYGQ